MGTYSFQDVNGAITGAGGAINLGNGAGNAEEGILIEQLEDKNIMTIGADGQGMHSLVAGNAATVTVTLLKTSPVNAQLMQMYNYQKTSSVLWGKNTIVISDFGRGDLRAVLAALDALHAVGALLHHAAGADGDVGLGGLEVQRHVLDVADLVPSGRGVGAGVPVELGVESEPDGHD